MGNPIMDPEMGIYEEEELKAERRKFDDAFAALMKIVVEYNKGEAYLGDVDEAIYKLIRYGKPRLAGQHMVEDTADYKAHEYQRINNDILQDEEDIINEIENNDDKKKLTAVRAEMMRLWNTTSEAQFKPNDTNLHYDTVNENINNVNVGVFHVQSKLGLEKNEIQKKYNKLWICPPGSYEPILIKREGNKFTVRENCSTMEMYADLHREKMVAPKPPKGLVAGILNRLSKAFLNRPSQAFRDYSRAMARYMCSQQSESYGERNLGSMGIKEEDFPNIKDADQNKVAAARKNLVTVLQSQKHEEKILWKNIWRRLDSDDTKVLDLLASKDSYRAIMNAINTNDKCDITIGGKLIYKPMFDIDASVDYIRSLSDKLMKLPKEERTFELKNMGLDENKYKHHLEHTKAYKLIKGDKKPEKADKRYDKDIYSAFESALGHVSIRSSQLKSRLANYSADELDKLYLAYAKGYLLTQEKKKTSEALREDDLKQLKDTLVKVVEKKRPSNPLTTLKEDIDKRAKDLIKKEQSEATAGAKVTEAYKKARKAVAGIFGESIKSKAKKTNISNEKVLEKIKETIDKNENFIVYGFDDKVEGFKNLFKEAIESNNAEAVKFARNVSDWNGDDIYNLYLQYFERPDTISKCILNPNEAQLAASENTSLTYSKEEYDHELKIDKASEELANKQEGLEQAEMDKNQPGKNNDEPENVVVTVPGGPK